MKRSSTPRQSASKKPHPVVPYPNGYKGQALLPDLIQFSNELPRYPKKFLGFFKLLFKEFARNVGCGTSVESLSYLDALASGESYFWSDNELPEIVLVSTLEDIGETNLRVLKIMPRKLMLELYFSDSHVLWLDAMGHLSAAPKSP